MVALFWDVAPCNLVDTDRSFKGTYTLHYRLDDTCHLVKISLSYSFSYLLGRDIDYFSYLVTSLLFSYSAISYPRSLLLS
jgi:hypothetical protein